MQPGPLKSELATTIESYDLASGNLLGKAEIPGRSVLLDVSADGSLYLTGDQPRPKQARYSRLDVWDSKDGKHLVGWRPAPPTAPVDDMVSQAWFAADKTVLVQQGSRVTKRYHPPRTPYQRVLASNQVSEEDKQRLRQQYLQLNPAQLHRDIRRLQEQLLISTVQTAAGGTT